MRAAGSPSARESGQASPKILPSVALCFSFFRFVRSGTICVGGGIPTRSRANSFTAVTARNRFTFFLRAMPEPGTRVFSMSAAI